LPISFLNPGLLFGAAAAAVPLILHLLRNRRVRRVPFGDLRFLREVEVRRSRTSGLRRWLLLLLRMLAILLLVTAAARPRLGGLAPAAGERVSLLVILDASASMQTSDREGRTRFDEALDAAEALSDGLPGGSEVQWLRAGPGAEPVFGGWLPAAAAGDEAPQGLAPGDGVFDLVTALQKTVDVIRDAARPPLVVLVSDFQALDVDDERLEPSARRLNEMGVLRIEALPVGAETPNGAVLDVALPVRTVLEGETIRLHARVRPVRSEQVVRLELDGGVVGEAVAAAEEGETTSVTFAVTAPAAGFHAGRVFMGRDRSPADDQRAFVLEVRSRMSVMMVHGEGRDGWRYAAHALAPGFDRGGSDDEPTDLVAVGGDGWSGGDLQDHDVLMLVDPDPLGRERLADLRAWVERGGGCWIVAGDPARGAYLSEHLLPALMPGAGLGRFRLRGESGTERLDLPTPVHPLLEGLPDDALATLREAEWSRAWSVESGDLDVAAALEGGDPLLVTSRLGEGRILLMASGFDRGTSTLADNAMFPPLVHRAAVWLGAGGNGGRVLEAGRPLSLSVSTTEGPDLSGDLVLEFLPADSSEPERRERATLVWNGGRPRATGPAEPGAGVWLLTGGNAVLGAAVTVVPAAESDAAPAGPERLNTLFGVGVLDVDHHLDAGSAGELGALLAGRDLTTWLFLAAALVLLMETRIARGDRPRRDVART